MISLGPVTVDIPQVVGHNEATATQMLLNAGFAVTVFYTSADDQRKDVVISQNLVGAAPVGTNVAILVGY